MVVDYELFHVILPLSLFDASLLGKNNDYRARGEDASWISVNVLCYLVIPPQRGDSKNSDSENTPLKNSDSEFAP